MECHFSRFTLKKVANLYANIAQWFSCSLSRENARLLSRVFFSLQSFTLLKTFAKQSPGLTFYTEKSSSIDKNANFSFSCQLCNAFFLIILVSRRNYSDRTTNLHAIFAVCSVYIVCIFCTRSFLRWLIVTASMRNQQRKIHQEHGVKSWKFEELYVNITHFFITVVHHCLYKIVRFLIHPYDELLFI